MQERESICEIRWMQAEDVEKATEICSVSENYINSFLSTPEGLSIVATEQDKVIGFILYKLKKTKLIIDYIATDPKFQRKGIGSELIKNLFHKLNDKRTKIETEVSEYNLTAQLFFSKLGFKAVEIKKRTNTENYKFRYARPQP